MNSSIVGPLNDDIHVLQVYWDGVGVEYETAEKRIEGFAALLAAISDTFACCSEEEKAKPLATVVRNSRRVVLGAIQGEGPPAELAKAMMAYAGPQMALERAHQHSSRGMEDAVANSAFIATSELFENTFDQAFTDLHAWLLEGNSGAPQDFKTMSEAFTNMKEALTHLHTNLGRWSAGAAQENRENIETMLTNMVELLKCGEYTMIRVVKDSLLPNRLAEPVLPPAPEAPVQEGADEAHESAPAPDGDNGLPEVSSAPSICGMNQATAPQWKSTSGALLTDLADFANQLNALASDIHKVAQHLYDRVGPAAEEADDMSTAAQVCIDTIAHNFEILNDITDYACSSSSLVAHASPKPMFTTSSEMTEDYFEQLLRFAKLHYQLRPERDATLSCNCVVDATPIFDVWREGPLRFRCDIAASVYKEHVEHFMKVCNDDILKAVVPLAIVDVSVIKASSLDSLLKMVVSDFSLVDVADALHFSRSTHGRTTTPWRSSRSSSTKSASRSPTSPSRRSPTSRASS